MRALMAFSFGAASLVKNVKVPLATFILSLLVYSVIRHVYCPCIDRIIMVFNSAKLLPDGFKSLEVLVIPPGFGILKKGL